MLKPSGCLWECAGFDDHLAGALLSLGWVELYEKHNFVPREGETYYPASGEKKFTCHASCSGTVIL
jgi:hypothetical protein